MGRGDAHICLSILSEIRSGSVLPALRTLLQRGDHTWDTIRESHWYYSQAMQERDGGLYADGPVFRWTSEDRTGLDVAESPSFQLDNKISLVPSQMIRTEAK